MNLKHFIFLALPSALFADAITPGSYTTSLDQGENITIRKTVTISQAPPTSAKVDVFFLTDATGSMGSLINSVKSSATQIFTNTASLGDVSFGVGEYRDIYDSFTYRLNTDITNDLDAVQSGINQWNASGGDDWPEANLYALEQVAKETSWRDASTRILVWFGDAPGHDPRSGSTEASAIEALQSDKIVVEALNIRDLDEYGQATRVAEATGGDLWNGAVTSNIVEVIGDAIEQVFQNYNTVSLEAVGNEPGVGVSIAPVEYTGTYDRSEERTFDFDVTFTGIEEGTHSFSINALVDGGIVATESDIITVNSANVPEPLSIVFLGMSLLTLCGYRLNYRKK